jgi:hypothetical protein
MGEDQFYSFDPDEQAIVLSIMESLRLALRRPELKPVEIVQIGKCLFALARLPRVTRGSSMSVGLVRRTPEEMNFYTVRLDCESFGLNSGGSVYDPAVGSDTFSTAQLEVRVGWRDHGGGVPAWLQAFEDLATDDLWHVSIEDNCDSDELDMAEAIEETDYWQRLPDVESDGEDE